MKSARGFTLVEIMVALGLSSMVATGVLVLTRSQLSAYEMNDSVIKSQQNVRAGLEFVETQFRRTCGGISQGAVTVNLPGAAPWQTTCVRYFNAAATSGASFTSGSGTGPDAIELLYATGNSNASYASVTSLNGWLTTTPSVIVSDMSGFAVNDTVMVTNFKYAELFRIATINGGAGPASGVGPVTFGALAAPPLAPTGGSPSTTVYTPVANDAMLKVSSSALYFVAGTGGTPGQLYLDPDGMIGTDHSDAQPLIDGVSDFQLAFGIDWQAAAPATGTQNDGVIAENLAAGRAAGDDEWVGNAAGEALPAVPVNGWNATPSAAPMLLQIRSTIVVRTSNAYVSAVPAVGPYENGASISTVDSAGRHPRFRTMRSVVAPRAWNLGE